MQLGVYGRNRQCLRPSSFSICKVFVVDKRRKLKESFNLILLHLLAALCYKHNTKCVSLKVLDTPSEEERFVKNVLLYFLHRTVYSH